MTTDINSMWIPTFGLEEWTYQSFLLLPTPDEHSAAPGTAITCKKWARGKLRLTDSEFGYAATGTLAFAPSIELAVSVRGTPGVDSTPATFEATGTGLEGKTKGAIYELAGWAFCGADGNVESVRGSMSSATLSMVDEGCTAPSVTSRLSCICTRAIRTGRRAAPFGITRPSAWCCRAGRPSVPDQDLIAVRRSAFGIPHTMGGAGSCGSGPILPMSRLLTQEFAALGLTRVPRRTAWTRTLISEATTATSDSSFWCILVKMGYSVASRPGEERIGRSKAGCLRTSISSPRMGL